MRATPLLKEPDLKSFENYLKRCQYAKSTIENYMLYFKKLVGLELTQQIIDRFCDLYPSHVARAFLKVLVRFTGNHGVLIPECRGRKKFRLPCYLTKREISDLMASTSLRNKLMIALAFEGGLRNSEVVNLRLHNIDLEQNHIRGIGKGDKEFIVYFSQDTKKILLKYLRFRGIYSQERELFKIGRDGFYSLMRYLGWKVLGKKIYPHMLRHSTATYLLSEGWNVKQVQNYMRHANLQTTSKYLHVTNIEVKQKFKETFNY